MRWIKQRTTTDCGIAAVAIVAGVSYEEAKAAFGPFPGRGFLTEAKDLRRALKALGVPLSKRLRRLRGATQIRLKCDAIALVGVAGKNGNEENHWIVWDALEQRLLDPERRRAKETYAFFGYLKVKGSAKNPARSLE
jgi:hypothetical protein